MLSKSQHVIYPCEMSATGFVCITHIHYHTHSHLIQPRLHLFTNACQLQLCVQHSKGLRRSTGLHTSIPTVFSLFYSVTVENNVKDGSCVGTLEAMQYGKPFQTIYHKSMIAPACSAKDAVCLCLSLNISQQPLSLFRLVSKCLHQSLSLLCVAHAALPVHFIILYLPFILPLPPL